MAVIQNDNLRVAYSIKEAVGSVINMQCQTSKDISIPYNVANKVEDFDTCSVSLGRYGSVSDKWRDKVQKGHSAAATFKLTISNVIRDRAPLTFTFGTQSITSEEVFILIKDNFTPGFNSDFTVERYSTSAGAVSSDGTKLLVKNLKLSWNKTCGIESYSGITVRKARLFTAGGAQVGSDVTLTSGQVQSMSSSTGYSEVSPTLLSGLTVDKTKAYRLEFEFGDQCETVKLSIDIPLPQTIVDFGLEGGFAIGMYSNSTEDHPMFEVAKDHETHFYSEAEIGADGKPHGGTNITGVNSYLEGEHLTGGTWVDGKPIYRYIALLGHIGPGNYTVPGVNFSGVIETLVSMHGTLIRETNGPQHFPIPFTNNTKELVACPYITKDGNLILQLPNMTVTSGHMELLYTKANPSASPNASPSLPEPPGMEDAPDPDQEVI